MLLSKLVSISQSPVNTEYVQVRLTFSYNELYSYCHYCFVDILVFLDHNLSLAVFIFHEHATLLKRRESDIYSKVLLYLNADPLNNVQNYSCRTVVI